MRGSHFPFVGPRGSSAVAFATVMLAVAGCGGGGNEPNSGPSTIVVVSGANQQGAAGLPLPQPVVVEVRNAAGDGVAGVQVVYAASGGSSVAPATRITDGAGQASVAWTMPTLAQPARLEIVAVDIDTVYVDAEAVAGTVSQIQIIRGDSQAALVGTALDTAVVAQTLDQFGNAAPGVELAFAVISGGGSVSADTVITDLQGRAQVSWVMGPAKGYDTLAIRHLQLERRIGAIALPLLVPDSLAAGEFHTCVLDAAGQVYCFGLNFVGEVGTGDTTSAFTPAPLNAPAFRSIVAGASHTCGLTPQAGLYCWGTTLSLLGLAPTLQATGLAFTQITAGSGSTCGVTAAGAGYCWGQNGTGQLGEGSTTGRPNPTPILGNLRFRQIDAHYDLACGLTTGGRAYCWGGGKATPFRVSGALRFSTVAVSSDGACALTIDGAVWCWNWATYDPALLAGAPLLASLDGGGGGYCGAGPWSQGYCWGLNSSGQVGDGTLVDRNAPAPVSGGHSFTSLARGGGHSCGRTTGSGLYCWGGTPATVLGIGESMRRRTPTAVMGGLMFQSVKAGRRWSCGVTLAGTGYCWGENSEGQLGDGTLTERWVPTAVAGGLTWTSIAPGGGGGGTCGVATGGVGYCWGGTTATPGPIPGGLTVAEVDPGVDHACVQTPAGELYCWGANDAGQLGDSTNTARAVPALVAGGYTWTQFSAGAGHSCGVDENGVGRCWGTQLGLGNGGIDRNYPDSISLAQSFTSVVTNDSGDDSCGVTTSGEAWCWGSMTASNVPVPVPGGHQFAAVTIGTTHVCGLTTGGQVLCWGDNNYAQLGDGTTVSRTTPAPVGGGQTFSRVSAGEIQTCAVDPGGVAYCWGGNDNGALGIGTAATMPSPVQVW